MRVGWARWMKMAISPEPGVPRSPPWSTTQLRAGVFTAEVGITVVPVLLPLAIAVLVALAMAWIAGERRPTSGVLPDSSASSGWADDDTRIRASDASISITPGASGRKAENSNAE